jgi:molybdate transport system substrate-binding protein
MRMPIPPVFAAAFILAGVLLPGIVPAAEVKLMCPAPMRTTITDLVAEFERATPHKVTIVHTPSRMIVISGGEAFDVSILTAEATDGLIKLGKVAKRVDIARSSIGLAVRSGAPAPDVSSAEAVKRTLLAAKAFARNEGAESGKHMLSVFARLGITEQMAAKTKAMPVGTGYFAELVARGEAELAAQQMPELKAVAGVDPSIRLPLELQLIIVFSAGISPSPKAPEAVNALVAFLSSPNAAATIKSKGSIRPDQSRRNTTEANQPVNIAIIAAVRP